MEGWWDANRLDEFFSRFHSVALDKLCDKQLILNTFKARL
jgi:hypothetical protein